MLSEVVECVPDSCLQDLGLSNTASAILGLGVPIDHMIKDIKRDKECYL